jgi:chorismate mutase
MSATPEEVLTKERDALDREITRLRRELMPLESRRQAVTQALAVLKSGSATGPGAEPTTLTELRVFAARHARERLTLVDQAIAVLKDAKTPLSIAEIVKRIQARGAVSNRTLPDLRASLVPTLDRRIARGDTFYKPQPGVYGLREWESKTQTA